MYSYVATPLPPYGDVGFLDSLPGDRASNCVGTHSTCAALSFCSSGGLAALLACRQSALVQLDA
eukprot:12910076-Prorocentrum_lima.AAC.1